MNLRQRLFRLQTPGDIIDYMFLIAGAFMLCLLVAAIAMQINRPPV
ncbi:hypothetical protein [Pelagovum sp. HNIBRBA483]